jgi:hypothetical protein
MTARRLYASVTGCSGIRNVAVTESHDASTAMCTIETENTTLTLGDSVSVNMGYSDDHQGLFTGYVKQIDKRSPETIYTITCADVMTRAMDYFIASDDPLAPLKFKGIKAEELIRQLMAKAGLTNYTSTDSSFTFGISKEFEVNLVPVFDYCRAIADNLTWSIWADSSGTVHFANRKPYPMTGSLQQPGWVNDTTSPSFSFNDVISVDMSITTSEKNLRNRVVVYGSGDIHATASRNVSALPNGFFKTSVLGAGEMVDDQSLAQSIADYNLDLFCRYTEQVRVTIIGDPSLRARTIIGSSATKVGISGNWYVEMCDHSLSSSGYVTSLGLRRMPVAT